MLCCTTSGMVKVPVEILRAPRSLTSEEFERVKLRTTLGYRIMTENKEFSYLAAHVALEHHERLDGSGYPRGLRGDKILDIGRIVAVADVFCAMTEDRPHRKRFHPHEAIRYLRASAGRFDQRFVRRLALGMASYPNGTFVPLSTGDFGVVVRQDKRDAERPVIRILADGRNTPVEPFEIALADMPKIQVTLVADAVPEDLQRVLEIRRSPGISRATRYEWTISNGCARLSAGDRAAFAGRPMTGGKGVAGSAPVPDIGSRKG